MLVTPLVLIQIFSKRMLVDWAKCWSDPRDEGHLACLWISWSDWAVCLTRYLLTSLRRWHQYQLPCCSWGLQWCWRLVLRCTGGSRDS